MANNAPQPGQAQTKQPAQGQAQPLTNFIVPGYSQTILDAVSSLIPGIALTEGTPYYKRTNSSLANLLTNLSQSPELSNDPAVSIHLYNLSNTLTNDLDKVKEILHELYNTYFDKIIPPAIKNAGSDLLNVLVANPLGAEIIGKSVYQSKSKTFNQIKTYLSKVSPYYKRLAIKREFGGAPFSKKDAIDLYKEIVNASDMPNEDKQKLISSFEKYITDADGAINNIITAVVTYAIRNTSKAIKEDSTIVQGLTNEITSDPYKAMITYSILTQRRSE